MSENIDTPAAAPALTGKERLFQKVSTYRVSKDAKEAGIYPFFREIISEMDTEVVLKGGHRVLMLGSNSYLGLTNHPEVKQASQAAVEKYGSGCAGSRFLNGTLDIHEDLEAELAEFVGKQAAILFSTGFQVNLGVISAMTGRHDHVLLDKLDHASIVDGARLSSAKVHRFSHNDMADLEKVLKSLPAEDGKLIVVDGVFSMEGDIARMPEIMDLADRYSAAVMVDDAHALGVLGRDGRGTADHFGLTDRMDFIMATFSKSLASLGGFVASDQDTIEYIKHHARALIFSASMPPASAAAAQAALRIIKREPERIERLWRNTKMMREGLQAIGYNTGLSETPVIPVYIGEVMNLALMNKRLEEEGVFVNPVVPPAVPPTDCLVRISLMATHTRAQIEFGLEKMEKVGRELGVV